MTRTGPTSALSLHTMGGRRKYLTPSERIRFIAAARGSPPELKTLCLTLAWTGCRITEALNLVHADLDRDGGVITIRCLKKRREGIVREVPIPITLMKLLTRVHGDGPHDGRLWPIARVTAWRQIKNVMRAADVGATAACPKGLRHGFGVHAVRSGVPLNLLQRWLGHADIATTAIYANVIGPEEREIAARMW